MPIASGSNVTLSYLAEVTRGTTPGTGTYNTLRATSQRAINLEKNLLESDERRGSGMESDVRHGFNRVVGPVGFQLALEDYDDMFEYAFGGTWDNTVASGSINLDTTVTTNTITRPSGSFVTDGFRPGDIVDLAGTNADDGQYRLATVAALTCTTVEALTTDTGDGDESLTLTGQRLDLTGAFTTMTMERRFLDLTVPEYQVFRGVGVQSLEMAISPEAIATATLNLLGMSGGSFSTSTLGSPAAAQDRSPLASFEGALFEGGTQIALATGMNLTLNNRLSTEGIIGSRFTPDVFQGTKQVTADFSLFMEDSTILQKFIDETESSSWLTMTDINDVDFLNIVMPRLTYTGGTIDPPAEGGVVINMPFRALEDTVSGTALSIQSSV